MRQSYGKPYGTAARVRIGQILISLRTKEQFLDIAREALRRARMKFPGRQIVVKSKFWGFTDILKEDFEQLLAEGKVENRGVHAKRLAPKGKITLRNLCA
jgi:large subunit ribosomal protein L10e